MLQGRRRDDVDARDIYSQERQSGDRSRRHAVLSSVDHFGFALNTSNSLVDRTQMLFLYNYFQILSAHALQLTVFNHTFHPFLQLRSLHTWRH